MRLVQIKIYINILRYTLISKEEKILVDVKKFEEILYYFFTFKKIKKSFEQTINRKILTLHDEDFKTNK